MIAILIIKVIFISSVGDLGSDKIPKLARALDQAKKEFERAQREFTNTTPEPESTPTAEAKAASNDYLIQTAKNLGIGTAGKTRGADFKGDTRARTRSSNNHRTSERSAAVGSMLPNANTASAPLN